MVIVLLVIAIISVGVLLLYRRWVEQAPLDTDCVLTGENLPTERWLHSPLPDSVFSLKQFPALY